MQGALLEQFVGTDVGDYHLERLLGCGQLGAVYRAHQLTPNRHVTLTLLVLPEDLSTTARQLFRARLLREARVLVEVRHLHLLPLEAYGEWEGFSYLITPAQPTRSLATMLKHYGPCTASTVLPLLEQITAGLEHAHCRGLMHGALTLSHLLCTSGQQVQVAGLGLQRLLERRDILPGTALWEQALTLAGTRLVAERYLAPECLQLGQVADIRSDVYSLGVILGELLTGTPPRREASSPQPAMEERQDSLPMGPTQDRYLPSSLERILQQALDGDPSRRFQRVSDLLAAFAEGLVEEKESSPMASACWFCPLFPAVEAAEPETRHQMQEEDEVPGAIAFPWAVPHAATSGASPSLSSGFQVERQENGRFRTRPHAVRGRVGPHRSAQLSRRRALGRLVKAGAVGALAASVLGSGYLLTTALLKRPSPSEPGTSHPQQALNTAQIFTNPKDGRQGLLVRLPDGTFVAYARACTHSGVYVNYDSKTHLLVCPAHGAIFDPAHGGRVVQGPAPRPLPQVPLRTGSDGTIIIGE